MSKQRFTLRSAVYLILKKENKVFLLRRFNTGWEDGNYTLVAGHIDGNESVYDAIIREAYEEAGVQISKEQLKPIHVIHRQSPDQEYVDFFFLADSWSGEPCNSEKDKCDHAGWFPLSDPPKNILPYVKNVLTNFDNITPFSEFGWEIYS